MKKTRKFNIHNLSKYVPIAVILLAVSIIIGSTFAYFTDSKQDEGTLIFSKVELSNESTTGINGTLQDVIPGTPLIDSPITFSKSIDSEPMYVRVKLSYSLPIELQNNEDMLDYVTLLREAKSYDVMATEQNGAVWSAKDGNYFYLLDSVDNARLKVVDDVYTYKFTDSIIIPRDLEQLPEHAQYMQVINFHLAIEAIQAENVSDTLAETKEMFNSIFPQSDSEVYNEPISVNFYTESGEVLSSIELKENGTIASIDYVPTEEDAIFKGWYIDAEFTQAFDFDTVINENINLYPKVLTVNYDNFEFSGSTLTKFVGTDTEVIVPSSYSINGTHEVTTTFEEYHDLYDYINEMTTETVTVTDSEGQSYTFRRWEYSEDMYNCAYPVSFTDIKDKYVKGNTYQVTKIGDEAFYLNGWIEKVVLPESITEFGTFAFSNCSNLADINFPEALTAIKAHALRYTRIKELYVGENLTSIAQPCFLVETMEKITIHPNNTKYYVEGNCLIERDTKTLILGCNNSIIPNGVQVIGGYSFFYVTIEEITIPSSVVKIENQAFYLCDNLIDMYINSSTIASNPNSGSTTNNYLLSYVDNVYIKTSITSVSSKFKKVDNTIYTYEGVNYYLYKV